MKSYLYLRTLRTSEICYRYMRSIGIAPFHYKRSIFGKGKLHFHCKLRILCCQIAHTLRKAPDPYQSKFHIYTALGLYSSDMRHRPYRAETYAESASDH